MITIISRMINSFFMVRPDVINVGRSLSHRSFKPSVLAGSLIACQRIDFLLAAEGARSLLRVTEVATRGGGT